MLKRAKQYDQFQNVEKTSRTGTAKPVKRTSVPKASMALGYGVKASDIGKGYCSKPIKAAGREKTDDGHERARAD